MLVRNRVAYELDLDPGAVRDTARRHRLLLRVAKMLDLPPRPLWERVDRQLRMDPVAPVTLATDIDVKLKWYLQENPTIFHGLSVAQVPLRFYPYRTLGAHIYGQLSRDRAQAAAGSALPRLPPRRRDRPERRRAALRRVPARHRRHRRRDGRRVRPADGRRAPRQGARARAATCASRSTSTRSAPPSRRSPKGVRGAASAGRRRGRDRRASTRPTARSARWPRIPTFDPNWFISFRKPKFKAQLARITRKSGAPAHYPLLDRAIAGRYPAASTFKPFVAIAAVKERRITHRPAAALHAAGLLLPQGVPQLGHVVRRPHQPDRGARALVRHLLLPPRRPIFREGGKQGHPLQNWAAQVRLRQDAPASTSSARTRACCPTPPGRRTSTRTTSRPRARPRTTPNWLFDSSWNAADELNLSIGQGNLNVTPLQLAVGYSAIANGGTVVTPHVVERDPVAGRADARPAARRRRGTSTSAGSC